MMILLAVRGLSSQSQKTAKKYINTVFATGYCCQHCTKLSINDISMLN
jgi:hypothetical protein